MAGRISMGARREVVSAVTERYRSAKRAEKGRMLDALCATTGWHRKHAVRALRQHETVGPGGVEAPRERRRRYGATIKDALTALWEASDRVCGKRLTVMIPCRPLSNMADCSLARRTVTAFWPSAPQPSTACSSTYRSPRT